MSESEILEEGKSFSPRFDEKGLIPCVTVCADSGQVLMVAYMNVQSLDLTLQTGEVHYWSRSRGEIWHKGATSGFVQHVVEIRTDCDQDCLLVTVKIADVAQAQATCHTGRKSCFYRRVISGPDGTILEFVDAEKVFDPKDVYSAS